MSGATMTCTFCQQNVPVVGEDNGPVRGARIPIKARLDWHRPAPNAETFCEGSNRRISAKAHADEIQRTEDALEGVGEVEDEEAEHG